MKDIIVSVDIGSSKIAVMIGLMNKNHKIEFLGKGIEKCTGIKKGAIVDIQNIEQGLMNGIRKAENESNLKISSAYVNIVGTKVNIQDSKVGIQLDSKRGISSKEIEKLFDLARRVKLSDEDEVIDVMAKDFTVDKNENIMDPRGMKGSHLEANVKVVFGKSQLVRQIISIFEKLDIAIDGFIIEGYAVGNILLKEEEKNDGVVLIDIGGSNTNISVFQNEEMVFYSGIPVGGDHITNDISIGLKIPNFEAEKLKREFGVSLTSLINNQQIVEVKELNNNIKKNIRVSDVVEIIEARIHEVFSLARSLMEKNGMYKDYKCGIVLTGGGISYIDGCDNLAKEVFNLPVRTGVYKGDTLIKPEENVLYGIIGYVAERKSMTKKGDAFRQTINPKVKRNGLFGKIIKIFSTLKI